MLGGGAAVAFADSGDRRAAAPARGDAPAPVTDGDARMRLLWDRGLEAYRAGKLADAAAAWQGLLAAGVDDASVHYDLGNAYFEMGQFGRAIVCYERVLRLEPGAGDAELNLAAADRAALAAARDDPAGALGRAEGAWTERLARRLRADDWAMLFAAAWLACFGGLTARRLVPGGAARAAALALAIAGASLLPFAGASLWARAGLDASHDRAVVVAPRATLRRGPSPDNAPAFDVREGIRVKVSGEDAGWLKVRLTDGLEAWAPPGVAERI
ncbi:MAG TPA: tetratricopeptide repeat protein [Myxococcota bacterium]|jgi:tetratricopeptide (TPR) repeat protein|nr:tetratricopeptide repeat protein [Myxococcota bacterium]